MIQQEQKWAIDFSHSKIGFSVKHFGITETEGFFKSAEVAIWADSKDFSDVKVDILIDANSINTNDEQRDGHLKSVDFFETEKFPKIHFKSTSIEKNAENNFKLNGNLTIKDHTKPIALELGYVGIVPKDPYGNTKVGLALQEKINRKDFGLVWNVALDHGGVAVSETVKINCPIQLLKIQ
ncbi:MAG: YceI family protein [Chitinophagaceae bacterium]